MQARRGTRVALRTALTAALLGAWASDANAVKTWRVDDDGGPGVDFTDIQPAIDAASAGDRILVATGTYQGFTLGKGLTIVGPPDRSGEVIGPARVIGLLASERAVVTGLTLHRNTSGGGGLVVDSAPGPVVLDNLDLDQSGNPAAQSHALAWFVDSADVRMIQSRVSAYPADYEDHAARSSGSRLELVECLLRAGKGRPLTSWPLGWCQDATDGGTGLWCEGGSTVSVFRTTCVGGDGGDLDWTLCEDKCWGTTGADGGYGLLLDEGSLAVVAGAPSDGLLHGAASMLNVGTCMIASDGFGLVALNGSVARTSGVTIDSLSVDSSSTVVTAVPDDPFLERLGRLEAGQLQTFRVRGTPGDSVVLHLGRDAVVIPDLSSEIDQLVTHDRSLKLGSIPASGVVTYSLYLPPHLPAGFTFFVQADVTTVTGLRRTNSLSVVVRVGS